MAFFKKAAKGKSPGILEYTEQDMKHAGWCHRNKIFISVIPKGSDWQVEIQLGDKIHMDPKTYEGKEALKQMYKYYKYYYDKH